jgi:polar amino acid transport system substrate-binding protein
MSSDPEEQRHGFLSTAPASRTERRLAFAIIVLSVLTFAAAVPFARMPLAALPAFIPSYEAALAINDRITSVLLFGQYSRLGSRALLALACGYLFDALVIRTIWKCWASPIGARI